MPNNNDFNFIWSLLWLFFMLSAIQPYLQQRLLEAARQRKIARFSESAARE